MTNFSRLHLPLLLFDALIAHARREYPNECCGLLAGAIADDCGRVARHFPIRNERASPVEYFTNARDLLDAMKAMRSDGAEPLAIYHSHPLCDPIPSKHDVAQNTWGETVMHVIVGLAKPEPELRAWWIGETVYREAEMEIA
ncbi:MAG TPA: M67 family metallopeptidase [Urbifossiella sp.]|jgi:proteasome lid subunit RPN8/RPN11